MFGTHLRAIKPMASFRRKENNPQLNRLGALQIVFLPGVAEELLQKCLAAREEFFGPDHPDTMRLIWAEGWVENQGIFCTCSLLEDLVDWLWVDYDAYCCWKVRWVKETKYLLICHPSTLETSEVPAISLLVQMWGLLLLLCSVGVGVRHVVTQGLGQGLQRNPFVYLEWDHQVQLPKHFEFLPFHLVSHGTFLVLKTMKTDRFFGGSPFMQQTYLRSEIRRNHRQLIWLKLALGVAQVWNSVSWIESAASKTRSVGSFVVSCMCVPATHWFSLDFPTMKDGNGR